MPRRNPRPGKRDRQEQLGRKARIARTEQGLTAGNYASAWPLKIAGKGSPDWSWDWKAGRRINNG
jgi:hypothetical protein